MINWKLYLSDLDRWRIQITGSHVPVDVDWHLPYGDRERFDEDTRDLILKCSQKTTDDVEIMELIAQKQKFASLRSVPSCQRIKRFRKNRFYKEKTRDQNVRITLGLNEQNHEKDMSKAKENVEEKIDGESLRNTDFDTTTGEVEGQSAFTDVQPQDDNEEKNCVEIEQEDSSHWDMDNGTPVNNEENTAQETYFVIDENIVPVTSVNYVESIPQGASISSEASTASAASVSSEASTVPYYDNMQIGDDVCVDGSCVDQSDGHINDTFDCQNISAHPFCLQKGDQQVLPIEVIGSNTSQLGFLPGNTSSNVPTSATDLIALPVSHVSPLESSTPQFQFVPQVHTAVSGLPVLVSDASGQTCYSNYGDIAFFVCPQDSNS